MTLKSLLRAGRSIGMAIVEQIWILGFALGGRVARPVVRRWSSPGRQRVLVIAPHPDDEACGCGGTLIRHRQRGDWVCVAYITDGRRSRALGLAPDAMARRRRQEAEACARILKVDRLEWLGVPEGEWSAEQLQPRLRALIDQFAPDVIYAPSRIDFHPEHHKAACALALALAATAAAPLVRAYQVQVPLTPILTNLVADLSDVAAECAAALDAYTSQRGSVARTLRQRHYGAAFYGLQRQAEEFWELPADRYTSLHAAPPDRWPAPFRSLRFYPWSDPLAYLYGMGERRRAARLISNSQYAIRSV
jgi:LmbE family N-acetylglucosaminyl deacetylase